MMDGDCDTWVRHLVSCAVYRWLHDGVSRHQIPHEKINKKKGALLESKIVRFRFSNLLFFCKCSDQVPQHVLPGGALRRSSKQPPQSIRGATRGESGQRRVGTFAWCWCSFRCFLNSHVARRHLLAFRLEAATSWRHTFLRR
jgi:hypothetical protein